MRAGAGFYPENLNLPPSIYDRLPPEATTIWRHAFNRAFFWLDGDEEAAERAAWKEVKKAGYEPGVGGATWIKTEVPIIQPQFMKPN